MRLRSIAEIMTSERNVGLLNLEILFHTSAIDTFIA